MMRQAAIAKNPHRLQEAMTKSLPAPVGGLNDRDSEAAMDDKDALILDNLFPLPSKVMLRKGSSSWATGLGNQVESLMGYKPASGTSALFAAAGTSIYNVASSGVVGHNYLNFPADFTGQNYATTPDSSLLDITGDIEFIAYVAMDSWMNPGVGYICDKGVVHPDSDFSYQFAISGGYIFIKWSANGAATNIQSSTTNAIPFANGNGGWVRGTLDVNDSGSHTLSFYTSSDPIATPIGSITWSAFGVATTLSGTTSIYAGTAHLTIGDLDGYSGALFQGKIYKVNIYSGIGGTLKASFDANDGTVGSPTITSSGTGEVYTVHGAAAIAGPSILTGLTNARWQHINMATSGGNFLMAVNGADKLRGWNGTAWWTDGDATHDITGADSSTFITATLFKRRAWFIQKSSTKVWYLPIDSIAGVANSLDFGSIFPHGGQLMAMADWSIDAGQGIDDYAAFISDQGDVALYKGSDPTSATTWALVGVFWVGAPVGRRCFAQYGPDVLLISKDGLVPLSKALMSSRVNTKIALTDKIQNSVGTATTAYGSTFGWQVIQYPAESMIVLNVPVGPSAQQQYVMNTISGAWCRFKGWNANCFELYNDELYFGGSGTVYKAWQSTSDDGANINAEALGAFSYFGNASMLKEWTLAQPLIAINNSTGFLFGINTDFDRTPPIGVPTFVSTSAALWDVGLWDVGLWGGNPVIQKYWQSVNGIGYSAAIHILSASNSSDIEWSATNFLYKPAGVL